MKAILLENIHQPLVLGESPTPQPTENEVLVKISAAALNHRDVFIQEGLYPGIKTPVILGSDGVGQVVEVGSPKLLDLLNTQVILNPNIDWGESERAQTRKYQVLGMPSNGCLAEYVCVPADRLAPTPTHLSVSEAAALPLAGLTAFRALFGRGDCQKGEKVFITGIGGGVALFALQFAVAAGAEVWVSSSDDTKIQKAVALGAKGGVNYKNADWAKQLAAQVAGFDLIIDSAGGEGFGALVDLAAWGGRIVFYGGTHGAFKLNPQKVFWKQLSILGSTMGSDKEFQAMVAFVNTHQIRPVVDTVWTFEQANEAFEQMRTGKQFGKIVLSL
jgi:zinc-binding alcohol dehydrogenase/oxidoreductase